MHRKDLPNGWADLDAEQLHASVRTRTAQARRHRPTRPQGEEWGRREPNPDRRKTAPPRPLKQ